MITVVICLRHDKDAPCTFYVIPNIELFWLFSTLQIASSLTVLAKIVELKIET